MLFVTRKFPPSVGGMQRLAGEVAQVLEEAGRPRILALGRSQVHLAWFLPLALARTAFLLVTGRVRRVLCGDALVHAALRPALRIRRPWVTVMIHGLDLTYRLPPYRWWVRRALRRADLVVTNSSATRRVALAHCVSADRVRVVNPGISRPSDEPDRREAHARLLALLSREEATILVTVGRLVARKGVAWFVERVFPALPEATEYVVLGEGPERRAIADAAARAGVASRVRLLGRVDDEVRDIALRGADLFVMPNIAVEGDMEGFGLVAVEAAAVGTPVVASRIGGIVDAVGESGVDLLCPPSDAEAFRDRISDLLQDPEALRERGRAMRSEVRVRFSSERFANELLGCLRPKGGVSA